MRLRHAIRLRVPSSRDRGRRNRDYYPTPRHAIDELLDRHPPPQGKRVLEPCAGDGAIVRALVERGYDVTAVEVRAEEQPRLEDSCAENVVIDDWLEQDEDDFCAFFELDAAVTNPPFSMAQVFARSLLSVDPPLDYVALLLGIDVEASGAWRQFWADHPWTARVKLFKRPSFTGDGRTDGRNYCWFIWEPNNGG